MGPRLDHGRNTHKERAATSAACLRESNGSQLDGIAPRADQRVESPLNSQSAGNLSGQAIVMGELNYESHCSGAVVALDTKELALFGLSEAKNPVGYRQNSGSEAFRSFYEKTAVLAKNYWL